MRIRLRVFCLLNLLTVAFCAAGSASVAAQGGTGKMPPMRTPPAPSIHRAPLPMPKPPPARKSPAPVKRQVITDVYVVPATTLGSSSTTDRLPESLGQFRRNKLETNVADSSNQEYGAVEAVRAEYGKDILIFLSRFRDSAVANTTMQAYAKKGGYSTLSRKQIKNRSGQTLGEFWMLKGSGRGANILLLATSANYLYRVSGSNSDDVEKVFKLLPLQ